MGRPVVKYFGSKYRLALWIISHFPEHVVYVEPYGGGAGVLLRKRPAAREVYNDLDGEIVGLFRVLRDDGMAAELERRLRLTPFSRAEYMDACAPGGDSVERARRALCRAFMGFGSRGFYSDTGFRGPAEGMRREERMFARYPLHIREFTDRLRRVVIENKPALDIFREYDGDVALFYADPPYVASTLHGKREVYPCRMSDSDHREMAGVLHGLRGMVALSGFRSALYEELFGDWRRVDRRSRTAMNSHQTESLWLSPRTVERLGRSRRQTSVFDLGSGNGR